MDGANFEQARYAGMRWNTPLSETCRTPPQASGDRPLPFGARPRLRLGGLLLRAVADPTSSGTAVGVDTDTELLERGRAAAAARGIDDR